MASGNDIDDLCSKVNVYLHCDESSALLSAKLERASEQRSRSAKEYLDKIDVMRAGICRHMVRRKNNSPEPLPRKSLVEALFSREELSKIQKNAKKFTYWPGTLPSGKREGDRCALDYLIDYLKIVVRKL